MDESRALAHQKKRTRAVAGLNCDASPRYPEAQHQLALFCCCTRTTRLKTHIAPAKQMAAAWSQRGFSGCSQLRSSLVASRSFQDISTCWLIDTQILCCSYMSLISWCFRHVQVCSSKTVAHVCYWHEAGATTSLERQTGKGWSCSWVF